MLNMKRREFITLIGGAGAPGAFLITCRPFTKV
jgi:hypothetical protein